MVYYHLRYNFYPPPGAPVEREEWIALKKQLNSDLMTSMLSKRCGTVVTIILSSIISIQEYELKAILSLE